MLDEYKKIATQLVALKSVSADPSLKGECKKTAEFLQNLLVGYGFTVELIEGYGNPIVLASYEVNPSLQTCLVYGHYDVQPAAKENGWDTDPFVLTEKNGRLYGRGIMDDKCQFLIHILTIGKLIKTGKLGYNITFMLEGNEEEGSPYTEKFITDHKHKLTCDFALISDGEMTRGKPTLELGNRGILNWTLTLHTSISDIHSGIFGGAAPNAAHELVKFVSGLLDGNNRVAIEGFYDDVEEIEKDYAVPFDFEEYKRNSGTKAILTEPEYDYFTQTGLRPSMTVTGMFSGYIPKGHKTTIPASATVKINFRLVKNQDPHKIAELTKKHIEKVMSSYVDYDVSFDEFAGPVKTDKNNAFVQKAKTILEDICSEQVIYRYVGGTEPVILFFQDILKMPVVSVPFANEDGFMHGINENFTVENVEKGLQFSEKFFGK